MAIRLRRMVACLALVVAPGAVPAQQPEDEEPSAPASHRALNLTINGFGLSIGNSARVNGIRINAQDYQLDKRPRHGRLRGSLWSSADACILTLPANTGGDAMRILLPALLVLAACARESAQTAGRQYIGTWDGRSFRSPRDPNDTGVTWVSVIRTGPENALQGRLVFKVAPAESIDVRVTEVTDTTLVQELGPYHSVTLNAHVVTRAEGRISGDSIWGTFAAVPVAGGDTLRGTFGAKRRTSP